MSTRIRLALFVPLALLQPVGDPPPAEAVAAQALAKAGKKDEAFAKALEGLEFQPNHPLLLDLAAHYADELEKHDEALWYASLGLQETLGAKEWLELNKDLSALATKVDPLAPTGPSPLLGWSTALLQLGKTCASRKLFVNAVDLFTRLSASPLADKAENELQAIYANKPAVASLLESGMDVPLKSKRAQRSPEAIAHDDAKHNTWDTRWKIKDDNYTIETDMGSEFAESVALAMDQMNHFYRKVFHVKERGGETARVTIKLYRSRAEFDAHETEDGKPVAKEVRGFFANGELKVATYDHRTDGLGLAFTWSTLFHESSHQFTALISVDRVPAWLNEGTASYFEGARLQPNGTVITNLVAERRLTELKPTLDSGHPSLEEVVSFNAGGSYPGEDYPVGWGLVYFLHNFEDENSTRPYLPIYQEFIASYRTGGGKEAFPRFVEYFVTKAKQPGIETFGQFEARFKSWIGELHALYFGGSEKADVLIERARKERTASKLEYAIESYRWALRKRPGDALANFELGDLFAQQKDKDRALYHLRGALRTLAGYDDPGAKVIGPSEQTADALSKTIQDKLVAIDKDFAGALSAATQKFEPATQTAARDYVSKSFPISALRALEIGENLGGKTAGLRKTYDEIAADSHATTDRWRRVSVPDDLAGWEASSGWTADKGSIQAHTPGLSFCIGHAELEPHCRFEAKLEPKPDSGSVFGLVYAAGDAAYYLVAVFPDGQVQLAKVDAQLEHLGALAPIAKDKLAGFVLGFERFDDHLDFFVDGQKIGTRKATEEELQGHVGLFAQASRVHFSELRLRQ